MISHITLTKSPAAYLLVLRMKKKTDISFSRDSLHVLISQLSFIKMKYYSRL